MTEPYRIINGGGHLPPVVYFRLWKKEHERIDALVELLGPEFPIYEVPPPDEAGDLTSVAAWVSAQRRVLSRLPLEPPYRFMGWSFAGLVSLELARQLQTEGVAVEHVALIDVGFPLCRSVRELVGQHARQLRQLSAGDRWAYASSTARRIPTEAVRRAKERRRRDRARENGTNPRVNAESPALLQATDDSYFTYRSQPYDGAVTLYVTTGTITSRCRDASTGWQPWLRSLEIVTLPGSHFSIWQPPHTAALADALLATALRLDAGAAASVAP